MLIAVSFDVEYLCLKIKTSSNSEDIITTRIFSEAGVLYGLVLNVL